MPKPGLAADDVKFMEDALRSLPTATAGAGESSFADRLLQYGYHQNPYVRLFTKVLWSGYAISRGQLAECDARFKQAHNDATMSNIDRTTVKALEQAHAALQESLAPGGSTGAFLGVLRDTTMQRMWARVCETAMLPPPSFHKLFGAPTRKADDDDYDAAEQAEIAELMKDPEAAAEMLASIDTADDDGNDRGDDRDESTSAATRSDRRDSANAAAGTDDGANDLGSGSDDDDAEAPPESGDEPSDLALTVKRSGDAPMAAELVLAAAAELLKGLRAKGATGAIEVTLSVTGTATRKGSSGGGRRRRSRKRR